MANPAQNPPALRTAFDGAVWFLDRARADDIHLPPQKLQRLLFIAQAAYAGRTKGALLMPALFVADELGPVEPNLMRLLSEGRPDDLPAEPANRETAEFLEEIWRRFAQMSADRLNGMIVKTPAYAAALAAGRGALVAPADFAPLFAPTPAKLAEDVRVLRSQSGAPVAVRAWTPGRAKVEQDR